MLKKSFKCVEMFHFGMKEYLSVNLLQKSLNKWFNVVCKKNINNHTWKFPTKVIPKQARDKAPRLLMLSQGLCTLGFSCRYRSTPRIKPGAQEHLFQTILHSFQDVDEFVSSSDLEKCSIASLSQQWILCSEWVPSE